MVFEYILKKNGIDPKTDLSIDQSINFGLTAAAFTSNDADYTVEFEPFATALELEGNGHVAASLGESSGYVPYTAYCAKKSYIEKNPEIIQKFTNAIQKGLEYVNSHTSAEIAKTIKPQFKETDEAAHVNGLFAEIFNDRRRAPSRDRNEIAVDRSIQVCDHDFGSAPVVWSFP